MIRPPFVWWRQCLHRSASVIVRWFCGVCLFVGISGCGAKWDCTHMSQVLVEMDGGALTCEDVEPVSQYLVLLSGRDLDQEDRRIVVKESVYRFKQDVDATRAWLETVTAAGKGLAQRDGVDASKARSQLVYQEANRQGVLGGQRGS